MILVERTPFSFRVKIDYKGCLYGTDIFIRKYQNSFTRWGFDPKLNRGVPKEKYFFIDKKRNVVYFPRYDLNRFVQLIESEGESIRFKDLPLCEGADIDISLKSGIQDQSTLQTDALEYLTGPFEPLKGISLQTGKGKSYVAIKYCVLRKKRVMIGCKGLVDQWVDEIFAFTDAKKEDVYIIQGQDSLIKLLDGIDKTIFPKFIVYSIPTLRPYAFDADNYEGSPLFDDLPQLLNVGLRITDEAHLNFHCNYVMDLRLCVNQLIPLTATFDVSDSTVKRIFDGHYPPCVRFGEDILDKYIDVYAYGCRSGHGDIPRYAYQTPRGYSHVMYEKWLLTRAKWKLEWLWSSVYRLIINEQYISKFPKPGQKLLILCETKNMCNWISERFKREYPQYKDSTGQFLHGDDKDLLKTLSVIVSTPKSCGTGKDIKRLMSTLNTISIRSEPLNIQILGRIRKPKHPGDSKQVQMSYVFNKSIMPQVDHHHLRERIYKPRAKSFTTYNLHN
jgi:hypothetical protein